MKKIFYLYGIEAIAMTYNMEVYLKSGKINHIKDAFSVL